MIGLGKPSSGGQWQPWADGPGRYKKLGWVNYGEQASKDRTSMACFCSCQQVPALTFPREELWCRAVSWINLFLISLFGPWCFYYSNRNPKTYSECRGGCVTKVKRTLDHRWWITEVDLGPALTEQLFFSDVIIWERLALAHLLPLPQSICGFQGPAQSLYFPSCFCLSLPCLSNSSVIESFPALCCFCRSCLKLMSAPVTAGLQLRG